MSGLAYKFRSVAERFDERPALEKLLMATLVIGALIWGWASFVYQPLASQTETASRQLLLAQTELFDLQQREASALASSATDPNEPVRVRIERAIEAQRNLDNELQALAGNLVTPQSMTRLLTSILERQSGLQLVSIENSPPQIVTSAADAAVAGDDGAGQHIFRHSITVQLEGDYLNLIAYLRRIESFQERFFWDLLTFEQMEWPRARISLELHTLSTDEGFLGV